MSRMIPMTTIPISNKEIIACVKNILIDGIYSDEKLKDFETKLLNYLGTKAVFTTNQGRTSLYIALRSLNLKPKDEVIVPAYSCAIVYEVILRLGLKPVLVDVRQDTYNIDQNLISKNITKKTKVILPVHLFGCPCEMDVIMEEAENHGLFVIEDVAQALGAMYNGKKVGTFGDLAIFSFGPGKSITGGEGGAISINNEDLSNNVWQTHSELPFPDPGWLFHIIKNILAMYFFSNPNLYWIVARKVNDKIKSTDDAILKNCINLMRNENNELNLTMKNMRMPYISATLLSKQISMIEDFNKKRISNALYLTKLLKEIKTPYLELPYFNNKIKNTFNRYAIKVMEEKYEKILRALYNIGIEVDKIYNYLPLFLSEYSSSLHYYNAHYLCNSLITIPNHPLMKKDIINQIYDVICDVSK